jgi:hypothetical protein
MTKRELIARLVHEPILIERVSNLSYYRIAPHGDPDPASVWIALVPVAGAPLAEDHRQAYARMNGRTVRLTYRETEEVVARLGRLFVRGGPRRVRNLDS